MIEDFGNPLYGVFLEPDASSREGISSWIETYKKDKYEGISEFISFVLYFSGSNVGITRDEAEDLESAVDSVAQIQDYCVNEGVRENILGNSTSSINKTLKKRFLDFLDDFIEILDSSEIIYEDNEDLINILLDWVSTLTSSALRQIRQASTLCALHILCKFCEISSSLYKTINTNEKIIQVEKKKIKINNESIEKIENTQNNCSKKLNILESWIMDLYKTVYLHRYKDTDSKIRLDGIKYLYSIMIILPEIFFEPAYLRYLGWLLSDNISNVRLEVITTLQKLYSKEDFIAGLQEFTVRFQSRLIEMAIRDSDENVRLNTILLLIKLFDSGFLDLSDQLQIAKLSFDTNAKVRKAALKFLDKVLIDNSNQNYLKATGKTKNTNSTSNEKTKFGVKKSWFYFKSLAKMFEEFSYSKITNQLSAIEFASLYVGLDIVDIQSCYSMASKDFFKISKTNNFNDLAEYLLFDTSITTDQSRAEKKCLKEITLNKNEKVILLEVLYGFISAKNDELINPKANQTKIKNENNLEEIDKMSKFIFNTMKSLFNDCNDNLPMFLSTIKLHRELQLDVYGKSNDLTNYYEFFKEICDAFSNYNNLLLFKEVSKVFLKALTSVSVSDTILPLIIELQEKIVNDLEISLEDIQILDDQLVLTQDLWDSMARLWCLLEVRNVDDLLAKKHFKLVDQTYSCNQFARLLEYVIPIIDVVDLNAKEINEQTLKNLSFCIIVTSANKLSLLWRVRDLESSQNMKLFNNLLEENVKLAPNFYEILGTMTGKINGSTLNKITRTNDLYFMSSAVALVCNLLEDIVVLKTTYKRLEENEKLNEELNKDKMDVDKETEIEDQTEDIMEVDGIIKVENKIENDEEEDIKKDIENEMEKERNRINIDKSLKLSTSAERDIMRLFLLIEKYYGASLNIGLKSNNIDELIEIENEQEYQDSMKTNKEEDSEEEDNNDLGERLEYIKCLEAILYVLVGRISLAQRLKFFTNKNFARITFNSKELGSVYDNITKLSINSN